MIHILTEKSLTAAPPPSSSKARLGKLYKLLFCKLCLEKRPDLLQPKLLITGIEADLFLTQYYLWFDSETSVVMSF